MQSNIKLGRISGIEIGLHYSWFIIAALIVLSLGEHFRQANPNWGRGEIWIAALFTAVLFFVSLLLHELAHSLVAQARGLKVRAITLFALGGVSQTEGDATDAFKKSCDQRCFPRCISREVRRLARKSRLCSSRVGRR